VSPESGPSAHVIAALLGLTGMALLAIYFVHSRERLRCKLIAEPAASIATTGALLSGWSEEKNSPQPRTPLLRDLDVTDTEEVLESKLRDWRFWLDEHGRLAGRKGVVSYPPRSSSHDLTNKTGVVTDTGRTSPIAKVAATVEPLEHLALLHSA